MKARTMRAKWSAIGLVSMRVALVAVACVLAAGGEAAARPPTFVDAASEAKADELRRKGNALSREGRIPEAIEAYRAAFGIRETYAVAANLGNLELLVGTHRDAAEHLAFALRSCPEDADPTVREALQGRLDQARKQVAALRFRPNVDGVLVTLNGRPLDRPESDTEVFVDPGSYTIEAARTGYGTVQTTIELKAGELREVALTLAPVALAPAAPVAPPATPGGGRARGKSVPLIVAGAGAATVGVVLGAIFTTASNGKASEVTALSDDLKARPGGAPCLRLLSGAADDCSRLGELVDQQNVFTGAAVGSFVAAGALAVGTGVYALWPTSNRARVSGTWVRAAPVVGARGGGLVVAGAF